MFETSRASGRQARQERSFVIRNDQEPARPGAIAAFLKVLRFYSRLPVPVFRFESDAHAMPDFARATWAIPIVGAVIGACGAGAGALAYFLGLSTAVAATLTIAMLIIVTGAFHEDGLADCCDGFWGGADPERRREIMKDSRVGTFGAAALVISIGLRILALTELFRLVGPLAVIVVIGVSAASRPLALMPTQVIPPAPGPGMGASTPMPGLVALLIAIALGLAILAGVTYPLGLLPGLGVSLVAAGMALFIVIRLAEAKIGGQTGDVLGAAQQLVEIALLTGLSAAANWQGPL
jgi:adenosylcobinamide-GDP ribazoletransferase